MPDYLRRNVAEMDASVCAGSCGAVPPDISLPSCRGCFLAVLLSDIAGGGVHRAYNGPTERNAKHIIAPAAKASTLWHDGAFVGALCHKDRRERRSVNFRLGFLRNRYPAKARKIE